MDEPNLDKYDHFIVAFSGGKDSLCCILHLLDLGIDRRKIELWHHDVDAGHDFMDWPVTVSYVRAVARALELPVYISYRVGGFHGEIFKFNARSTGVQFETPNGITTRGGLKGKTTTRRKFPQASADLRVRWCTSILKIDVGNSQLTQSRFNNKKILFITGERAEESHNRALYPRFNIHKVDCRSGHLGRHVDAWRPVHLWTQGEIWGCMRRWRINPHPCYRLGWGRCSCASCIFSSADQWASLQRVLPERFSNICRAEREFGLPIRRDGVFLDEYVKRGTPYNSINESDIQIANSRHFDEPVIMNEWIAPRGATAELIGPC